MSHECVTRILLWIFVLASGTVICVNSAEADEIIRVPPWELMTGLTGGVITTMSSRDSGYQGLHALEMLLHESSHAIVNPMKGVVADAISAAAKKRGINPPHDLWHAILFATSGELTRRFLKEHGVEAYVPSSEDLFARAWPMYRQPVEKYWFAYLNGEGTLEDAIDKIVESIPR